MTQAKAHSPQSVQVTAIVTHHNRPHLVREAVESLVSQSRRPDRIVVIDDASEQFDAASIPDHPSVSVYRSAENVGPYRLADWAIRNVRSDWYMIQDSDDVSLPTRLATLLDAAQSHGADMVGSAIECIEIQTGLTSTTSFEEDAVASFFRGKWLVCAWPSSILSRDLWARVGGLATGLRFSGDVEFVSRACHVGRIVTVPSVELRRRIFADSLTRRPDTGMASPARKAVREQLAALSEARIRARQAGLAVDLRPASTAPDADVARVR